MKMILEENQENVEMEIMKCQNNKHIQQVAFSTYHHALTQICFTCDMVRTSLKKEDLK